MNLSLFPTMGYDEISSRCGTLPISFDETPRKRTALEIAKLGLIAEAERELEEIRLELDAACGLIWDIQSFDREAEQSFEQSFTRLLDDTILGTAPKAKPIPSREELDAAVAYSLLHNPLPRTDREIAVLIGNDEIEIDVDTAAA